MVLIDRYFPWRQSDSRARANRQLIDRPINHPQAFISQLQDYSGIRLYCSRIVPIHRSSCRCLRANRRSADPGSFLSYGFCCALHREERSFFSSLHRRTSRCNVAPRISYAGAITFIEHGTWRLSASEEPKEERMELFMIERLTSFDGLWFYIHYSLYS